MNEDTKFTKAARLREGGQIRLRSEARRLVSAGEAATEEEGLELACAADPETYQIAHVAGAALARIEADDAAAGEETKGDPENQLRDAAERLVAAGDASDMDEGYTKAVEAAPRLYADYCQRVVK